MFLIIHLDLTCIILFYVLIYISVPLVTIEKHMNFVKMTISSLYNFFYIQFIYTLHIHIF